MRPGKKLITKLLPTCLALMAMLLVACGGGTTTTTTTTPSKAPASQQVLNMPFYNGTSDIKTFDPALSTDTNSIAAINLVFTGLVELDDNLKIQPQLASSYDLASDGLTWTFHLRPNLKFSDGTPLTSEDVVYSINRALLPATKSVVGPGYLALIKDSDKLNAGKITTIIGDSLLTPDANTVVIIANKKASYFLDALVYSTSYVVEKSVIDKYGKNWTDHLADNGGQGGDGPFKVEEYMHNKQIVFVPNPNYYGLKPQLQKVIFPFYKVADTGYSAYQVDQLDDTPIPTTVLQQVRGHSDYRNIPFLAIDYDTMNYLQKPFDVTSCRQAFALAINKDLIVKTVWKNSIIATNHIVPQGQYGYDPGLKGPDGTTSTAGNPTMAQQDEKACETAQGYASAANFPPITLTYSSAGLQAARNEVAAMQQMWQTVLGISVKTDDIDIYKLFADEALGSANPLQFYTGPAWIADYPDPEDWTTLQFDKGQSQNGMSFGQNHGPDAAAQQAVQAEMEAADLLTDPTARLAAYNKIEQELVNFVAWFPMEQEESNLLIKPCVQGRALNAFGLTPPDDWHNIYISTDTPCAKTS